MKTEIEVRAELARTEDDPRARYRTASVQINAPLALIQTAIEERSAALRWVLGERPIRWLEIRGEHRKTR